MLLRELMTVAMMLLTNGAATASVDLGFDEYGTLADNGGKTSDYEGPSGKHEVRCYCNQPECVAQGYMCRGRGCFTELPLNMNPTLLRPEHSAHGCLEETFKERQCPPGFLCCKQDLCNHVDSLAMRNRLNKTLQVLTGDQRAFLGPMQPSSHGAQSTDGWFRTATIAVPICGLIALLVLAGLAVRLLKPVSSESDKLGPHRTQDNAPPLLGTPKVPLV